MSRDARQGFAMSLVGGSSRDRRSQDAGPSTSARQRAPLSRADAFGDGEDDEHEQARGYSSRDGARNGRGIEAVTGFSSSGAEVNGRPQRREAAPAASVIPRQDDSNWMEERKRRLGLERYRQELGSLTSMRPPGINGRRSAQESSNESDAAAAERAADQINADEPKVGLQVMRKQQSKENGMDLVAQAAREDTPSMSQAAASPPLPSFTTTNGASTASEDEQARAALLLNGEGGASGRVRTDNVVIAPISEDEALRRDAETRPEAPTLSDYARMPVEDFGAALLRGMGWREGMGAGKKRDGPVSAPKVAQRASLLGLGAKERPTLNGAGGDSTGGTGSRSARPPPRPERRYVPVVRRERTPEKVNETEEDARAHTNGHASRDERSRSSRRSRSLDRSRRTDERSDERRRHRDYEHEDERHRTGDRDRDRDRDRRRDDDDERRRYRRRDDVDYDRRDRDRPSRHYDRDDGYDRERSHRHR